MAIALSKRCRAASLATAWCLTAHASAALVDIDFDLTSFSAPFAEHSSLFVSGGFSTWQGGTVSWVLGGQPAAPQNLALQQALQPWVATSAYGVQHSEVLPHTLVAPLGADGVVFADRLGWRTLDGSFFYPAWDTSPTRDNFVVFEAASPTQVAQGDVFRLGTFRVRNGSWHSEANGGAPVQIGFNITLRSSDPSFDGLTVTDTFVYSAYVQPGADALANADAFWIAGRPDLGAARVLEQGVGSFDLYARIGSLTLERLDGASGDVVLTAFTGPIPEPGPAALLLAGLGWVLWTVRGRARAPRAR